MHKRNAGDALGGLLSHAMRGVDRAPRRAKVQWAEQNTLPSPWIYPTLNEGGAPIKIKHVMSATALCQR